MIDILDYGMGNSGSILNMLKYLGNKSRLVRNESDILKSKKLIIPGVGSYDAAIESIDQLGLRDVLNHQALERKIPILGICLGAQVIAECFGAELFNLKHVMHGKKTSINILDNNSTLYKNIPQSIMVGRYHSWAINIKSHTDFITTATDKHGVVMSFRHINYPLIGIQYHPESVLTDYGQHILRNWLTNI